MVLPLKGPDVLNAEALEESQTAGVIRSDLRDAVAVVGHCEFPAELKPFLNNPMSAPKNPVRRTMLLLLIKVIVNVVGGL
jgi:hypothetical protein